MCAIMVIVLLFVGCADACVDGCGACASILVQLNSLLRLVSAAMLVRLMFILMLCVVVFAFMFGCSHVCIDVRFKGIISVVMMFGLCSAVARVA